MKRLLFIITLLTAASMSLSAQTGLNIEKLFESMRSSNNVTETYCSGNQLKPQFGYTLTLFHSLKVVNQPTMVNEIAAALAKDVGKAIDREMVYKAGRLTYAMLVLSSTEDRMTSLTKCIFFSSPSANDAMLIYIEGLGTPEKIRSLLWKRND